MTTVHDVLDLEQTQGSRYRCPLCDARRALSVDTGQGDTGVWHCFSCLAGGDGLELVMRVRDVDFPEACRMMGVEWKLDADDETDRQREARRRESAPDPYALPKPSDIPTAEAERFWQIARPWELYLMRAYEDRWRAACFFADEVQAQRYQYKQYLVMDCALRNEMRAHRVIDRLDSHTDHLDDAEA